MKKQGGKESVKRALSILVQSCVTRGNQSDLLEALRAIDSDLAERLIKISDGEAANASIVLGIPIGSDRDSGATVFEGLIEGNPKQRQSVTSLIDRLLHFTPEQARLWDEVVSGRRALVVDVKDDHGRA